MSSQEVAALTGKTERTVRRWAESGKFPAERTLNKFNSPEYFFSLNDLTPDLQEKYYNQLRASLPEASFPEEAKPKAAKPLDTYSIDEQEEIAFWLRLVKQWQGYARAYQAEVQMLNMAQENFRRMMDELDKYPDLDTTEAIIRLTSQNLLTALANTSEEDWQGVSVDKMLREANALVRAAAYKKRVEIQNQDTTEAGLDAVKSLVWEAMAKERPDLYRQVNEFLNSKKQDGLEAR